MAANSVWAQRCSNRWPDFPEDAELEEEIFGPATLLVRHANREQILEAARNFEGHLTATIHGTEEDLAVLAI